MFLVRGERNVESRLLQEVEAFVQMDLSLRISCSSEAVASTLNLKIPQNSQTKVAPKQRGRKVLDGAIAP